MTSKRDPARLAKSMAATKTTEQALRAELSEARKQVETLQAALDQARTVHAKPHKQKRPRRVKGDFFRFFFPDTHGCFVDDAALAACLEDMATLQPREIYLMGDHLDCGGFLAQHHTLGFVAEADYTFESDVAAANSLLDEVQKRCPKAVITYLEGNHEERLEKYCVTAALRQSKDAAFLRKLIGPESVLHLEKRGIRYITKGKTYDDCRVQGTVKAGKCYVTHGTRHGKNAAQQMLNRFGACVVFGHVHKLLAAADRNVRDGEFAAWSVGHLSRQQPLWRHGDPTDWSQGYGFQVVTKTDDFLHINVPIIEGRSYLALLDGALK